MEKFLIVGLGNIGDEYANTRHNIGFDVLDNLSDRHGSFFQLQRLAFRGEIKWKGRQLILIKPTTFMNESGKAVRYWMEKEKIELDHILIIVDDLALPISRMRVRSSGSDGGHNGLKSIFNCVGSEKYPRLRFGVGADFAKGRQIEYVLGHWSLEELKVLKEKIPAAGDVVESFVTQGIQRTMNFANSLSFEDGLKMPEN